MFESVHCELFDVASAFFVAEQQHDEYQMRKERDRFLAPPLEVAKYAEQLARRQQGLSRHGRTASPFVVFATVAGGLVYAMDHYGYSFVDIARITGGPSVARILSQISADPRAGEGPRKQEQLKHLKAAEAQAKIVRLAEILASAEKVHDDLEFAPCRANADQEFVLAWIRHQDDQLDLLKREEMFGGPEYVKVLRRIDCLFNLIYASIQRPRNGRTTAAAAAAPAMRREIHGMPRRMPLAATA